jgi:aminoglycoside phosphotransferase (APT) family kinase protein
MMGTMDDQIGLIVDLVSSNGLSVTGVKGATLRQLPGGWSRHSYEVSVPTERQGRKKLIVRVKPPGSLLETDLEAEYRVYSMLQSQDVPVPRVYGLHADSDNPFGGALFVMEWVEGEAPNVWQRRDRERLKENWQTSGSLGNDLVEILAKIHSVEDSAAVGVVDQRSYTDVVEEWEQTWNEVNLGPDPIMECAFDWLREREPEPAGPGLVHGDYRIGNTLLLDGRINGVIDWELCYWGDTRYDLGYVSLAYLAGKFFEPVTDLVSCVADREWFFHRYEELTGAEVDREVVRTHAALGAVSLIAILATGISQYHSGRTSDIRMAWNRFAIPGLRQDLAELMDW